jgi:hypothetical protein
VPDGFDDRVLASVPYAAYQAMEPLRRARVPVYLEENFLPAFVRAPVVRAAGLSVTALAFAGFAAGWWSGSVAEVSLFACLPELLVRLQNAGRRMTGAIRRTES